MTKNDKNFLALFTILNYAYSYSTTTLVFEIYQISHSMVPNQKIKET